MDLLTLISLLLTPITGIVTWIVGRKMQRLDYNDKSQEVIAKLQLQNAELLRHIEELEDKIVDLNKQLADAKTSLVQLQSTFDIYILEERERQKKANNGN